MRIPISGATHHGACEPGAASDVPTQEGWPTPVKRRAGRGSQFVYEGGPDLAVKIASHLEELSASFAYADDPETKAEGRAFRRDADRIRTLVTQAADDGSPAATVPDTSRS